MTVYHIPERVEALLFDIDATLYTKPAYTAFQNDVLLGELARVRNAPLAEIRHELARIRQASGSVMSLGNAMAAMGIDIATSVAWRKRLIDPGAWLVLDPELDASLCELEQRFAIAAVTNNPRSVGIASLEALGVRNRFTAIVGLDDTMKSKPAREPFELAMNRLGTVPALCISIGDRYDVDIAIPLELGCGGILVSGVSDIYGLPALLLDKGTHGGTEQREQPKSAL